LVIDLRYGRRRHQVERLRWTACHRTTRAECVYGAVSKPAIGINDYDYLARIRAEVLHTSVESISLAPFGRVAPLDDFSIGRPRYSSRLVGTIIGDNQ
jgi:hypothetical protein